MTFDRSAWTGAALTSCRGDRAARTVIGQLADRADRHGRVRARPADLAACTALSVCVVADVLADIAGRELLTHDGGRLLLVIPRGRPT